MLTRGSASSMLGRRRPPARRVPSRGGRPARRSSGQSGVVASEQDRLVARADLPPARRRRRRRGPGRLRRPGRRWRRPGPGRCVGRVAGGHGHQRAIGGEAGLAHAGRPRAGPGRRGDDRPVSPPWPARPGCRASARSTPRAPRRPCRPGGGGPGPGTVAPCPPGWRRPARRGTVGPAQALDQEPEMDVDHALVDEHLEQDVGCVAGASQAVQGLGPLDGEHVLRHLEAVVVELACRRPVEEVEGLLELALRQPDLSFGDVGLKRRGRDGPQGWRPSRAPRRERPRWMSASAAVRMARRRVMGLSLWSRARRQLSKASGEAAGGEVGAAEAGEGEALLPAVGLVHLGLGHPQIPLGLVAGCAWPRRGSRCGGSGPSPEAPVGCRGGRHGRRSARGDGPSTRSALLRNRRQAEWTKPDPTPTPVRLSMGTEKPSTSRSTCSRQAA